MALHQTAPFPHCCGIRILHSFGHTEVAINKGEPSIAETKTFLRKQERELKRHRMVRPSILMVTLNQVQMKKLEKLFIREGWTVGMSNAFHPNHGNSISLLFKEMYPEE